MRVLVLLFGLASIAWGVTVLPVFWKQSALDTVAGNIIQNVPYRPEVIASVVPEVEAVEHDSYCRPEALRDAVLVRLRMAQDAMSAGLRDDIDPDAAALEASIHASLACSPADPFAWMVLAWVDEFRRGLDPDQVRYLQLSYQLGPNEGWVAARRNRVALTMFNLLPPSVANQALDEFARMLGSGFMSEALAIFTGPGWHLRDQLLPRLSQVTEPIRVDFANELYREGYDVSVPGVAPHDPRPWD